MKTTIATITRQLDADRQACDQATKLANDATAAPPARDKALADLPGLIRAIDEAELALAILEPIDEATGDELNRWREGYTNLRDHCIATGVDLGHAQDQSKG